MADSRFRTRVSKCDRDGYVLLVVLAVSVLVVTTLATLAKVSLRRGLQAADAQRSLQQRWGALTLERAMLRQAPQIFMRGEETAAKATPGKPPAATIRAAVTIGGVTFDLLLGDEDAKLNLNALYHHVGKSKTERSLSRIAGPAVAMATRLVPAGEPLLLSREASSRSGETSEPENDRLEIPPAFRSWGEVFDLSTLEGRLGGGAALPNVTTGITCWGSGQLNFRRASDEAILAIVASVVQDGGARRLLTRYRQNPTSSIGVLLQTEVSNREHRDALTSLLSEKSNNFSIWIHASAKGAGSLHQFVVMNRDDEGVTRYEKFLN